MMDNTKLQKNMDVISRKKNSDHIYLLPDDLYTCIAAILQNLFDQKSNTRRAHAAKQYSIVGSSSSPLQTYFVRRRLQRRNIELVQHCTETVGPRYCAPYISVSSANSEPRFLGKNLRMSIVFSTIYSINCVSIA